MASVNDASGNGMASALPWTNRTEPDSPATRVSSVAPATRLAVMSKPVTSQPVFQAI